MLGDDMVGRLAAFVRDERLNAAVVFTCVGSTGTTRIRPAGSKPRIGARGGLEPRLGGGGVRAVPGGGGAGAAGAAGGGGRVPAARGSQKGESVGGEAQAEGIQVDLCGRGGGAGPDAGATGIKEPLGSIVE